MNFTNRQTNIVRLLSEARESEPMNEEITKSRLDCEPPVHTIARIREKTAHACQEIRDRGERTIEALARNVPWDTVK